jgi:hypothetical protein
MTLEQQQGILADLIPVCDDGDVEAISEMMNHHFHSLATARSVFCVTDEKYEREFLPESQVFRDQGYLRSLMSSRRVMNIKNQGEGNGFELGYTISLDTQFVSFLRRLYQGGNVAGFDAALIDCLKYLVPYRSRTDIFPYLFENDDIRGRPEFAETLEAFFHFRAAADTQFKPTDHFGSTLSDDDVAEQVKGLLGMLDGPDWRVVVGEAKKNWEVSYLTLLVAAKVGIEYSRQSTAVKFKYLAQALDEVGMMGKMELHFAHLFFQEGTSERFFRQIQANAGSLMTKLKNMAWDMAHWRNIFVHSSLASRVHNHHADFTVPYVLSFDKPFMEMVDGYRVNGVINYSGEGSKFITVLPYEVETSLSKSLEACEELFGVDKVRERKDKRDAFWFDDNVRHGALAKAEADLQSVMT